MNIEDIQLLRKFCGNSYEETIKAAYSFDLLFESICAESKHTNIMGKHELERFFERHVLDSIYPLKFLKIEKNADIIDLGSGAGFPGIPLKILRSDFSIISIESTRKKADFQRKTSEMLNLDRFSVVSERIETIARGDLREKNSIVVVRAVDEIAVLAEYALPMLKIGGKVIIYKAFVIDEELERGKYAIEIMGGKIEKVIEYIPHSNVKRKLVILKKVKKTSDKWPREPGMPRKAPIINDEKEKERFSKKRKNISRILNE